MFQTGVLINSGIGIVTVKGVTAISGDSFVTRAAGSVDRAALMANSASGVNFGVSWPAANAPTLGLVLVGNMFRANTATFNGFSHTSARINSKANLDTGGLMSETAIVP